MRESAKGKQAALFITCLGDQFYTKTLQNMTLLLERLGVELVAKLINELFIEYRGMSESYNKF